MFKLPDTIKKQLGKYEEAVGDFVAGRTSWARFSGIRVPWGNYSQRGGKLFMARIRIPGGTMSPAQLGALAAAAAKYGDGTLHLTTRQDVQIHNVEARDLIKIHRELAGYELSSRGGGGNTVRNITVCALSGISKDEIFDVRPDAVALTERLISEENSYLLPRKLKIAFSASGGDSAGAKVNDVGFVAAEKDGTRGYRVYVGGGMGAHSSVGRLLEEFVRREDIGCVAEAVKNVFYQKGDRRNKHHNRLRFLIQDIGFEKFREMYRAERAIIEKAGGVGLRRIEYPAPPSAQDAGMPSANDGEERDFIKYSVVEQKQAGYIAVKLRIPRGDISSASAASLAEMTADSGAAEFRASQNQNLAIVNVKKSDAHKLFLRLKETLGDFLYPDTLLDVTACKGAATCNLGLCNSPALARELDDALKLFRGRENIFAGLNIKINGCPNACARHPLGLISFHGMVRRVDGRPVPFYKLLVGGEVSGDGVRLARDTDALIPSRNVPAFVNDFIAALSRKTGDTDDVLKILGKYAQSIAAQIAPKYSLVPPYEEDKSFYIDWGRDSEFSLAGTGPGECGAGIMDMIESDLIDAKIALGNARAEYSPDDIKKALFYSARALAVVKGADPKTPAEAFADFVSYFVAAGISPEKYRGLGELYDSLDDDKASAGQKTGAVEMAAEFLEHINELYKSMDSSFEFPSGYKKSPS